MAKNVKPRRPYESPRRREQARVTRSRVLASARELFVARGYVPTTVEAIAERAGVSPETVYATFGTKRALLSELLDVSMAGDDAPVPVLDRGWVQDLRDEPDVRRRVAILAENGSAILERVAPLDEVLRGAAAADPQIARLWDLNRAQRFEGQRELVRALSVGGALREGLTEEAAVDIVFAIGSPETFRSLVVDRGWTPHRFARWYADTLIRLLIG